MGKAMLKAMVGAKKRSFLEDTNWDRSIDIIDSYHPGIQQSTCFDDGKRQIDYVLVYKPYAGKPDNEWTPAEMGALKAEKFGPANNVHYRLRFVSELIAEGLEV